MDRADYFEPNHLKSVLAAGILNKGNGYAMLRVSAFGPVAPKFFALPIHLESMNNAQDSDSGE